MVNISKWNVLDALSHADWKFPANLARELSKEHSAHITIAEIFVSLETLEDAAYVESKEEGKRRSFRKTCAGIHARQKETDPNFDPELKPI
jgi:hypothetical protein